MLGGRCLPGSYASPVLCHMSPSQVMKCEQKHVFGFETGAVKKQECLLCLPFPSVEILGIAWSYQDHGEGGVSEDDWSGGCPQEQLLGRKQETGSRKQDHPELN